MNRPMQQMISSKNILPMIMAISPPTPPMTFSTPAACSSSLKRSSQSVMGVPGGGGGTLGCGGLGGGERGGGGDGGNGGAEGGGISTETTGAEVTVSVTLRPVERAALADVVFCNSISATWPTICAASGVATLIAKVMITEPGSMYAWQSSSVTLF